MRTVEEQRGGKIPARWRSFPLEQINSQEEGWLFWEQSSEDARSLQSFLAAEAVADQGQELLDEFRLGLLGAIHRDKKRLQEPDTIRDVAAGVSGIDVERMLRDMERPELRERIATDYREAVDRYGVFGTPTLLFAGGEPVFLKMDQGTGEDAGAIFDGLRAMSQRMPFIREVKKPRPPDADR